jgi:glycosyltransferase involved in cell wall biosynthesis
VRFSIVTPSFNNLDWLKRCAASVADQQRVEVEHLVQDACSTDGTVEWLKARAELRSVVEPDSGMYDAINRGLDRATGEVLAWLNCDEQYLPGALAMVADYFLAHPDVEMVFGDVVMVDEQCRYLCHRRVESPRLHHTWVCHLSTLSCGMFFRRGILEEPNSLLDTTYRCGGDGEWMVRLLRRGLRTAALRRFTSVFARRGESNLSRSEQAREEWRRLRNTAPAWVRALSPWWVLQHRLRRFAGGSYRQDPFEFSIYTPDQASQRTTQQVRQPTIRCP